MRQEHKCACSKCRAALLSVYMSLGMCCCLIPPKEAHFRYSIHHLVPARPAVRTLVLPAPDGDRAPEPLLPRAAAACATSSLRRQSAASFCSSATCALSLMYSMIWGCSLQAHIEGHRRSRPTCQQSHMSSTSACLCEQHCVTVHREAAGSTLPHVVHWHKQQIVAGCP
jgi:hypothetical protein